MEGRCFTWKDILGTEHSVCRQQPRGGVRMRPLESTEGTRPFSARVRSRNKDRKRPSGAARGTTRTTTKTRKNGTKTAPLQRGETGRKTHERSTRHGRTTEAEARHRRQDTEGDMRTPTPAEEEGDGAAATRRRTLLFRCRGADPGASRLQGPP